jgi:Tripartite tricarboxylate transporter family receptor
MSDLTELGQEAIAAVSRGVDDGAPLVKCQLLASAFYEALRHELRQADATQRSTLLGVTRQCHRAAAANISPVQALHELKRAIDLAQAYPTRPVRWIVPAPPGGPLDIVARFFGQWLSERLGEPFIIENRPGGGTNIATEMVARAPADGYTLLSVVTAAAINATLYGKLSFNFIRDIAPVAKGRCPRSAGYQSRSRSESRH